MQWFRTSQISIPEWIICIMLHAVSVKTIKGAQWSRVTSKKTSYSCLKEDFRHTFYLPEIKTTSVHTCPWSCFWLWDEMPWLTVVLWSFHGKQKGLGRGLLSIICLLSHHPAAPDTTWLYWNPWRRRLMDLQWRKPYYNCVMGGNEGHAMDDSLIS